MKRARNKDEIYVALILVDLLHQKKKRKRKRATRSNCVLAHWLQNNLQNPYPSTATKLKLQKQTRYTMRQINNWFSNKRHENKKQEIITNKVYI